MNGLANHDIDLGGGIKSKRTRMEGARWPAASTVTAWQAAAAPTPMVADADIIILVAQDERDRERVCKYRVK